MIDTLESKSGRFFKLIIDSHAQPHLENTIIYYDSEEYTMTLNPEEEIARRRTFAIISHPDAGKTTITEKLLLFGGAIQMAGAVRGRRSSRHATSDFLKVEQDRGISVSSAVR